MTFVSCAVRCARSAVLLAPLAVVCALLERASEVEAVSCTFVWKRLETTIAPPTTMTTSTTIATAVCRGESFPNNLTMGAPL